MNQIKEWTKKHSETPQKGYVFEASSQNWAIYKDGQYVEGAGSMHSISARSRQKQVDSYAGWCKRRIAQLKLRDTPLYSKAIKK